MSVFEHGAGVLDAVVSRITDPEVRAAVEHDRDRLLADQMSHGLPSWDWQGVDDAPWATKVALLGGTVFVRYAPLSGYPQPAIVAASLGEDLHNPMLDP